MTIDIIIPCYYSSSVIKPCFEKISQQTVLKDIKVIMVNDCSPNTPNEYQDIITEFSPIMNIQYLKTQKNSGPGIARQLGLDNATSDWIMFIDDDDELYDSTSIERLLKLADIDTVIAVTGQSLHLYNGQRNVMQPWIHHHGSIYNRKLLVQKNIKYDARLSYLEEDGAFTRRVMYYGKDYKQEKLQEVVYFKRPMINHISLTALPRSIERNIMGLTGLSVLDLQYVTDAQCEFSMIKYSYHWTFVRVSNYLSFLSNGDFHLTEQQYANLTSFIVQLNKIMQTTKIELEFKECEKVIKWCNERTPIDNHQFSLGPLLNYHQFYLIWLENISNKINR